LDPFFRKRRIRHFINVRRRGKFDFWSRDKYRAMLEINDRLPVKNPYVVPATFSGSFKRYPGALMEEYQVMKAEKMTRARAELVRFMENYEYSHGSGGRKPVRRLRKSSDSTEIE